MVAPIPQDDSWDPGQADVGLGSNEGRAGSLTGGALCWESTVLLSWLIVYRWTTATEESQVGGHWS